MFYMQLTWRRRNMYTVQAKHWRGWRMPEGFLSSHSSWLRSTLSLSPGCLRSMDGLPSRTPLTSTEAILGKEGPGLHDRERLVTGLISPAHNEKGRRGVHLHRTRNLSIFTPCQAVRR